MSEARKSIEARTGTGGGDDVDALLDPLFAEARRNPPDAAHLAWFLRGVPRANSRRWPLRAVGALLASAAGIAVAVMLLWPAAPPAFAWQRVVDAMQNAPIVHMARADGSELWVQRGVFEASWDADGSHAQYWDFKAGTQANFQKQRNAIIIFTCDLLPDWTDFFGRHTLEGLIDDRARWGQSFFDSYRVVSAKRDDRDVYVLTATEPTCANEYVIDASTDRIISSIEDGRRVTYDYPDSGPRDLTELGVPADTPVIDGTASPELRALGDRVDAAQQAGFGDYRAMIVESWADSEWHRVTRDGDTIRTESFAAPDEIPQDPAALSELARELLAADEPALRRIATTVFDGETERSTSFDKDGRVRDESIRPVPQHMSWSYCLAGEAWRARSFFASTWEQQYEYLAPDDAGLAGYRGLGQANNVSRPWLVERWFDPEHGYRLAREIHWEDSDGSWQLDDEWRRGFDARPRTVVTPRVDDPAEGFESRVTLWDSVRPGEWYPAIRETHRLVAAGDGSWVIDAAAAPEWRVIVAEAR